MKRYLLISALLLAGALIGTNAAPAPFLQSEKMPKTPDQPEAFYALAGGTRLACDAIKVSSTGTVQMSCDLEALPFGSYPLVVVSVLGDLETVKPFGTLVVSKNYGATNYMGLRIYKTSYQVKP